MCYVKSCFLHNDSDFISYLLVEYIPTGGDWKKCVVKGVNENFLEQYYVDSNRWICSCPSFLQNRFLICKHLVKAVSGTATRLIYKEFKRNYEYPFLTLKPLKNT